LLYLFIGFALINDSDIKDNIDEKPKLWAYGPIFPIVHKEYNQIANYSAEDFI
jgi:uncharacterized phage-associated protein